MEEQKKSKEIRMAMPDEHAVYTYEQLTDICDQQQKYINNLLKQLHQANAQAMFKRLDYLFKVVDIANSKDSKYSFDDDFVLKAIDELQEALTIPEEKEGNPTTK